MDCNDLPLSKTEERLSKMAEDCRDNAWAVVGCATLTFMIGLLVIFIFHAASAGVM